jgi:mannose-6-phosphate isomerase
MPAPGEKGQIVEPGHHSEWLWLLDRYDRLVGGVPQKILEALHARCDRTGLDPASGLLVNEIVPGGQVRDGAKRIWPQTEAIKAELALMKRGVCSGERAAELVASLFDHFLSHPVRGAWCDRLDAANRRLPGAVPASSLYHIFLAFAELITA